MHDTQPETSARAPIVVVPDYTQHLFPAKTRSSKTEAKKANANKTHDRKKSARGDIDSR
jgi:hypothetical protein